jgi:hypothetical protein
MNAAIDLPDLERRAYQTLWEDGLIDVCAGLGLLGVGVSWIWGQPALGAVAPATLVPLWAVARSRISLPRAGYVEFGPARKALQRRHLGTLLLLGLATLALAVVVYLSKRGGAEGAGGTGDLDDWARTLVPALPCVLLGFGAGLVAALFGVRRFFFYAALLVGVGGVGIVFELEPGWQILASGLGVSAIGLAILIGFLRHNPVPAEPEAR